MFLNVMHKASSLQCIHYADDMTSLSKGNNLDDLIDFTNTELVKMDKWVYANKLSLNINMIAFSVCSTKSVTAVHRVKIMNEEINLNNFNFFEIKIDSNSSFSSQYLNVCNKTSRPMYVLSKLAYHVPQSILRKSYQTMIYPSLNIIMALKFGETRARRAAGIKRLQIIQDQCIKIISSTNTSEPSHYASLKLMIFKDIHEYFSLIRFFKSYKLNQSQNTKTKIENHQTNQSYSTYSSFNGTEHKFPILKTK